MEGDSENRKCLLEFTGFTFTSDSDRKTKVDKVVHNLSLLDLISVCNVLGIDYSGKKEELAHQACTFLMNLDELSSNGNTSENNNKNTSDNISGNTVSSLESDDTARNLPSHRFNMTFQDVESLLSKFYGSEGVKVEQWIDEFEEIATLMNLDKLQKLIFAKRSLSGLAKLFVWNERGFLSWPELKRALKEEFGTKITSAELHKVGEEKEKKEMDRCRSTFC